MESVATRSGVVEQGPGERLYHLDWLRVLAVLLLIPFHTARIFDTFEPFYIKSQQLSELLTWGVVAFFNTWHMPLLFLIAGAGSYLALGVRSTSGFSRERTLRLLVPLLFGLLVLVPPQAYVGAVANAGFTGDYLSFLTVCGNLPAIAAGDSLPLFVAGSPVEPGSPPVWHEAEACRTGDVRHFDSLNGITVILPSLSI